MYKIVLIGLSIANILFSFFLKTLLDAHLYLELKRLRGAAVPQLRGLQAGTRVYRRISASALPQPELNTFCIALKISFDKMSRSRRLNYY